MAVASLVLGILGLVLFFVPVLDFVLPLIGLILGIVALKKAKAAGKGKGLAIAGTVCSGVSLAWGIYETVVILVVANKVSSAASSLSSFM